MVRAASALALLLASALPAPFASAGDVNLSGAGATFPQELYKRWVAEYQKLHADVKIDYQGIGSGGGISGITERTLDFAGSDAPMNKKEIKAIGGDAKMVEIPSTAGGVVPAYNLPGLGKELNFTGKILADIYSGKITQWNDQAIAAENPGVTLPDLAITPAWRTDGSGTTFVFTNYLCTQSEAFKETIGSGKQVKFPVGQGGKGNPGVAQVVQQTKGAIGYIEQGFADAGKIAYGAVKNKAGKFVKASPATVSAAGAGAAKELAEKKAENNLLAANIWNQGGENAYPISSFTYLIVYKDLVNIKSKEQAQTLKDFLTWATHDGQKFATELDFAPLAPEVTAQVEKAIAEIGYKGETLK